MTKKIILMLMFFSIWGNVFALEQIEIIAELRVDKEVNEIESCILSLQNMKDETIDDFEFCVDSLIGRTKTITHLSNGSTSLKIVVEYQFRNGENRIEEQKIEVHDKTKRVEINLALDENDNGEEYLRDFTINKINLPPSTINLVRLHKNEIGQRPLYQIINNGKENYHGQSGTRHFYGSLHFKISEDEWKIHTSGSYCLTTTPEKVLMEGDTVFSYVPSYSYSNTYKLKYRTKFKYSVLLGIEPFQLGIPLELYDKAIARKRVVELYELEDEFKIEK